MSQPRTKSNSGPSTASALRALLLPGAAPWTESLSSSLSSALGRTSPLLPQAGLGMAASPQCCCIREILRNMLLARKEKKHNFKEKSKHERSRGTEREGFIQKQVCNQNQVRRHSQKFQEHRRNQNKTVRVGKNMEIKKKGTRGEAREAGNLLQN